MAEWRSEVDAWLPLELIEAAVAEVMANAKHGRELAKGLLGCF